MEYFLIALMGAVFGYFLGNRYAHYENESQYWQRKYMDEKERKNNRGIGPWN